MQDYFLIPFKTDFALHAYGHVRADEESGKLSSVLSIKIKCNQSHGRRTDGQVQHFQHSVVVVDLEVFSISGLEEVAFTASVTDLLYSLRMAWKVSTHTITLA